MDHFSKVLTNFLDQNDLICQVEFDRQIYKGVVWLMFGEYSIDVTEVIMWWKGLAKELELDIETLNDRQERKKQF
jgi:hypothetical protein